MLLDYLNSHPFLLAPMAGITDCPFRSFMRKWGAGIVTTELVSATGLRNESSKTKKLMRFEEDQRPVGVQIFGYTLEDLDFAARYCEQKGADFIDLNLGCPVPKVVKRGAGSALLKDLVQLQKVLRTLKSAVSIPVTIKIRTGWTQETRNADQVTQLAYDEGITWVAIHGRTRAQSYSGEADWDYISWVKSVSRVPVIGNGDLTSAKKSVDRLESSQCDGVMIGRGCLKNPWIFLESMNLWKNKETDIQKDQIKMIEILHDHLQEFYEERVCALQLKKFSAWYSSGYPGSAKFRKNIFQHKSTQELLPYIKDYFDEIKVYKQKDTSGEAFLMGGHG